MAEETDADVITNCSHTARPGFVLTLGWLYCFSYFVLCITQSTQRGWGGNGRKRKPPSAGKLEGNRER